MTEPHENESQNSVGTGAGFEVSEAERYSQSRRAEKVLDYVLHGGTEAAERQSADGGIAVEEAMHGRPVLDYDTGRTKSRVAFVTTDESVLTEDSEGYKHYLRLAPLFDEVHVLVIVPRRGKEIFKRAEVNVWFYRVHDKLWWNLSWRAADAAEEALTFNNSIRPDLIVGIDPFEAGLAAYLIAKRFKRPWQLHIKTNFFSKSFKEQRDNNDWRALMASWLLRRATSVRTATDKLKTELSTKYKKLKDIYVLPRFYNFSGLLEAVPATDIHERYKDYAFIMVAFGPLTADSHLHEVFTALRQQLLHPRIGLVVIGDGPAKELFTEKVKLLGIEKSVIFEGEKTTDLISYLKTADAIVEASTNNDSEVRILRAAAAGLPIIAYETDLRSDLFPEGKASFLCHKGDLECLTTKVAKFINSSALRLQFKERLQSIARERLQEDPDSYYLATRDTIESVLVPPKDPVTKSESKQPKPEPKTAATAEAAPLNASS